MKWRRRLCSLLCIIFLWYPAIIFDIIPSPNYKVDKISKDYAREIVDSLPKELTPLSQNKFVKRYLHFLINREYRANYIKILSMFCKTYLIIDLATDAHKIMSDYVEQNDAVDSATANQKDKKAIILNTMIEQLENKIVPANDLSVFNNEIIRQLIKKLKQGESTNVTDYTSELIILEMNGMVLQLYEVLIRILFLILYIRISFINFIIRKENKQNEENENDINSNSN